MLNYLALIAAIALASVAAYFSIIGLTAIFHGAFWSIVVMASVMEYAKLIAATYLHLKWDELSRVIIAYLVIAVAVLMLITSLGIFGYLSKAHIEQNSPVSNNALKVERIEQKISRENDKVSDAESVISQLDGALQTLIEYDKISGDDGYRAVREQQQPQRDVMSSIISESQEAIDALEEEKLVLNQQLQAIQLEVGPLRYIAALIYDDPSSKLEETVRILILLLVFVFDPLAVVLLITASKSLYNKPRKLKTEDVVVMDEIEEAPTSTANLYSSLRRRPKRPKWIKDAIATPNGWVNTKGELIKAIKFTDEEVNYLNREIKK